MSLSDETMVTCPPAFSAATGVGGDQVVGLPVLQLDGGDAERCGRLADQRELRDQLFRRRRTLRLVGIIQPIAERCSAGVEDHRDMGADMLAQQLGQHVGEAEHRVHRRAVRPRHRRQGAEDEARSVDQDQVQRPFRGRIGGRGIIDRRQEVSIRRHRVLPLVDRCPTRAAPRRRSSRVSCVMSITLPGPRAVEMIAVRKLVSKPPLHPLGRDTRPCFELCYHRPRKEAGHRDRGIAPAEAAGGVADALQVRRVQGAWAPPRAARPTPAATWTSWSSSKLASPWLISAGCNSSGKPCLATRWMWRRSAI